MRTTITRALAVALTLTLTACSGNDERPTGPAGSIALAPPATDPALGYPVSLDPSTPIYVAPGQRFGVGLEADPSAGFRWEVAEAPDRAVLTALGSEFLTTGTALGAPQTQVFSFVASAVGETSIELRYVGADGRPAPDEPSAVFHVRVTPDGQAPPETPDTTAIGA